MVILQQMIIFFMLMVIGVYARKIGLITESNQKQLSGIVISIGNPAMILVGSLSKESQLSPSDLLFTLLLAIGIFAFMILVAIFIPKLLGFKPQHYGIIKLMLVFSNVGFMGMPMVSSLYGSEALMYVTLFLIPFNVLLYTYGIYILQKDQEVQGPKEHKLKKLCNVGVIACLLAIILSFIPIEVPYVFTETISMLSKITGPLSMMIIGASLLDIKWKEVFSDVKLLLFSLLKMIILPVLILLVLKGFIHNDMLLGVCLVMLATPAGSMTVMFASQYDEKSYTLATKGVAITTVLSIVTMPLVSFITGIS